MDLIACPPIFRDAAMQKQELGSLKNQTKRLYGKQLQNIRRFCRRLLYVEQS